MRAAFGLWKIGWIVYLIQLLFVLPIGLQVYQVMEASFGQSMTLSKLMDGFDYGIIQDFMNVHGASLSPLMGYARWLILIYLLISAFTSGGIWNSIKIGEGKWSIFWEGCSEYFRRFLVIGLVFMLVFVVWSLVIWAPYLTSFFNMMETWLDDSRIVYLGILLLVFWMLGLAFLFVWSSFTKIAILNDDSISIWGAIKKGGRNAIRKYIKLLPTLLVFGVLIAALYTLNLWLEKTIGITSVGLILFFLVVQQGIIWLKIMLRMGVYKYLFERLEN